MMELKVKHKYTSTYDNLRKPRSQFFTIPIGQNTTTESRVIKGLHFECSGLVVDGPKSKELSLQLDQLFPADTDPKPNNADADADKPKSYRILSCNWVFKARAVIRKGTEVIFDSRGENEGAFTEVWGTTQTRRNIHTIVLGRDGGFMYNFIEGVQPERTLTVEAEVEIMAKVYDKGPQNAKIMQSSRATGLDMLELLRKDFSDVTIKCGSVDFKAHKVILKSYSPVFARMLDSPMDESATSVIHIRDFEPETIGDMITFMYEGILKTGSKDSIVALLDSGEKYDISELKVAVIQEMLANITPDNAAEFAAALTTFRADEGSKQAIFDYVKANLPQLRTNSHFRQFFKENVQYLL